MSSDQQLPSVPQMAANLATTASDVANRLIHGQSPFVKDEESMRRMCICDACEFFVKDNARCSKCGCMMQFKVRLNGAKCPINKW